MLLNVFRSSDIKNKNKISKSGDPYRILIGIKIVLPPWLLNTILVKYPVKKDWVNLVIHFSILFFFKIHRSLLYNIKLNAPLISKLSIDTIYPKRDYHAA